MTGQAGNREVFIRIAERTDLDALGNGIFDSFAYRPEYEPFRLPDDLLRAWIRWNMELVIRLTAEGGAPTEGELEAYREMARAAAAEGTPAELAITSYRIAARYAWDQILASATDDDRYALLEGAGLLFGFIDQISIAYFDAYREAAVGHETADEARIARQLIENLVAREELTAEGHALAARLGFDLTIAPEAFVVNLRGRPLSRYTTLAQRLRGKGMLASARAGVVTVLAHGLGDWREIDPEIEQSAVIVISRATPYEHIGRVLNDLRRILEIALARGESGLINADAHLPELILARSPDLAVRLHERVYGSLSAELANTLDVLVAHDFDRGRAAAAVPVHRNTLTNRVERIRAAAGIDFDRADGCAIAWLAWTQRPGPPAPD